MVSLYWFLIKKNFPSYVRKTNLLEEISQLKLELQSCKEEIVRLKANQKEGTVELFPNSNVFIEKELLDSIIFNRLV